MADKIDLEAVCYLTRKVVEDDYDVIGDSDRKDVDTKKADTDTTCPDTHDDK